MAHSLTTGMATQVAAASLAPVLFVEVDCNGGNVYMWSGFGQISWNGQTWLGAGQFGAVSALQETAQVQALGMQLTLSGIPSTLISTALQSLQRFLPVKIWLGCLTSAGAVVADPYLIFSGRCDSAKITATGATATIIVTAESRLIDMKRATERRYTDQDQQIDYPGDTGFSYVDLLQDTTIIWG